MNQVSIDRDALPAALLPLAKEHARVRHARDDALLTSYLRQAIDAVERRCSINLNPAIFDIELQAGQAVPCRAQPDHARLALPVNNVAGFTLTDAAGADQSLAFHVEQSDTGGSGTAYLVGPPFTAGDWLLIAEVGLDDPDGLAPAVLSVVLRIVSAYYEARESNSAVYVDDFTSELVSVWRPSV